MLRMKHVPTTAAESMSGSPRSKCIKEDEHMHSQKNFGDQKDFAKIRCALATATCLQHLERLAGEIGPDLFGAAIGITSP